MQGKEKDFQSINIRISGIYNSTLFLRKTRSILHKNALHLSQECKAVIAQQDNNAAYTIFLYKNAWNLKEYFLTLLSVNQFNRDCL